MNLFLQTRALTQLREDHLTAFLGAALQADEGFRSAYASVVFGGENCGEGSATITAVSTQVRFDVERARPDMMLTLEDGRRVLCEHKLDASETLHTDSEGVSQGQLERYLELPGIDAVTLTRSSPINLDHRITGHPKYLAPATGGHFLWRALYPPLLTGSHELTHWLREGFDQIGFTPPVPHIGDLLPDDPGSAGLVNQANFAKLWASTRSAVREAWSVRTGRRCELYLQQVDSDEASVYVSPLHQRGTTLLVRVPDTGPLRLQQLREIGGGFGPAVAVANNTTSTGRDVIDITIPLWSLLGSTDPRKQERALADFVVPLIRALEDDPR
ncbi:hypothetical protein [Ruania rhizosphaerae]|uniref:hypothetical protein n=1 Tax=Ruania rhizosphaerae TaxID=1840413 RepID=UPI00135BEC38|nr:hypothetical protein [Ruania rhizosphaerae]